MDDEKIKRLLEIVAEQIQSDKGNLTAVIDITVDFSIENSISPEILLSLVPSFESNGFHEAVYVLSMAASSLSTGHTRANAYYNAGTALTFMGRTEEAEAQYKLAVAADPNDVATHYNYGLLLQKSGRTEEAEIQYKLALAADPNDVVTHSNYGLLLQESGRKEEAEAQYKLALAADPNHVATHYNYGLLLQESGRKEEAEAQYKLALVSDPNDVATHLNYGILLQESGRIEEAEAQYKLALAADPNHVDTHYNYGIFLQESGRLEEAEAQYKLALAADPNDVATHSNYGLLLQESGRKEEAEAQYKLALAADPNDVATHSNYGLLLQESGRKEEAEAQYKLALAADPNHVATHYNYGLLLQESGRKEEAEAQYKLALAADPNHVATHYNYGLLLQESGRKEEAEAQYKLALVSDPNDVATHLNYGILLQESGRIEEAEAQYKLALAADPNHVDTHYNYGIFLQESGRLEEAEAQYKLALAADPNHANSHGAYGLLLFIDNNNKKALEETKIASQLFREKGDKVMEHLAMAWLFERYTEKYYEKGCLRNAKKKKSKGNFKKSGIYARLAGNEYINAAEYAGENARELSLTQGYTLFGRSEIRRLELSFLEGIRLRLQHLHSYDIAKFEIIMDGVKNASNYYKKAAEHSPERDPQCDACSKCMTTLSSILDFMLAIIHQRGVSETIPKLDDKINDWHQQLSDAEMVYKVHKKSEKGEYFVNSLQKLIDCLVNLEKYQNSTMHEYKKALQDCMTELKEVAENIEGPLYEIIVDSTKRMEKCALKQGLYTCGISDKSIEDQSFFIKKLKWFKDHPIKSAIGFIVAVLASYIANNIDKIRLFFNNFINF